MGSEGPEKRMEERMYRGSEESLQQRAMSVPMVPAIRCHEGPKREIC